MTESAEDEAASLPMPASLQRKLRGELAWAAIEGAHPEGAIEAARARLASLPADAAVHLGSGAHERWSVQRYLTAVTDDDLSAAEAAEIGLHGRRVVCWSPTYWGAIPAAQKTDNRVVCFFHHGALELFDDPQIVAAIYTNPWVGAALEARQPHKAVRRAHIGGAEDAAPHARRRHPGEQIRLFMAGNATGPLGDDAPGVSRKGAELLAPLAERLDPQRYAFVLVGLAWEPHAEALRRRGFTVICPGPLAAPAHYVYFGEGDVHLMLSRIEGGPCTLLEAMGVGMWTLATPTGIAPDVVQPGVNGHLLQPYDGANVAALAGEVAARLGALDAARLAGLRAQVKASVAERTWPRFKRSVDAILREALGVREALTRS